MEIKAIKYISELIEDEENYLNEYDNQKQERPQTHIDRCNSLIESKIELKNLQSEINRLKEENLEMKEIMDDIQVNINTYFNQLTKQ